MRSAVVSPMVFEHSLSMSQHLELQEGRKITKHYMVIVDLAERTWDWQRDGEPPADNPAYYLRFCKTKRWRTSVFACHPRKRRIFRSFIFPFTTVPR